MADDQNQGPPGLISRQRKCWAYSELSTRLLGRDRSLARGSPWPKSDELRSDTALVEESRSLGEIRNESWSPFALIVVAGGTRSARLRQDRRLRRRVLRRILVARRWHRRGLR